jgi:L-seryl-tRNA(Ser) seleniumtransferase
LRASHKRCTIGFVNESGKLRDLPAVHEVLEPGARRALPHALVVAEIRRALEERAREIPPARQRAERPWRRAWSARSRAGRGLRCGASSTPPAWCCTPIWAARRWARFRSRPAIPTWNTIWRPEARQARRPTPAALLERLLGAPAIAVNNNAAAIFLALNELAAGGEVVVSRGELIEIGDGFRIPEIMARSGARCAKSAPPTARASTITARHQRPHAPAAARASQQFPHPRLHRAPGACANWWRWAASAACRFMKTWAAAAWWICGRSASTSRWCGQPRSRRDLVSFSGDKLLGGPQAGILAGKAEIVARLRRNPLFRALRLDKLIYQALETTLRLLLLEQWERCPRWP